LQDDCDLLVDFGGCIFLPMHLTSEPHQPSRMVSHVIFVQEFLQQMGKLATSRLEKCRAKKTCCAKKNAARKTCCAKNMLHEEHA
jgi:hypothetical protein